MGNIFFTLIYWLFDSSSSVDSAEQLKSASNSHLIFQLTSKIILLKERNE